MVAFSDPLLASSLAHRRNGWGAGVGGGGMEGAAMRTLVRGVGLFGLILLVVLGLLGILRRESSEAEWIAFSSFRDGNWEIYRMRIDGTGVERLTYEQAPDWLGSWSPDGQWLAFYSSRDGDLKIY